LTILHVFFVLISNQTSFWCLYLDDKAGAQHGAAARAYDCFSLRRYKPKGMHSVRLGDGEPYMTENDAPPLPTIPDDIRNKIDAQRRRIATNKQTEEVSTKSTYRIACDIACDSTIIDASHALTFSL
jgi:hypothetical protein